MNQAKSNWEGYEIIPPRDQPYAHQRGTLTDSGQWMPLMIPKSVEVFNDYSRVILLGGARKSGKTMNAATNKILRHAWENDGSVIGIIGKTIRNVGEGAWKDLISFTLPGWIDSGIGMGISVPPKMTSDSHMRYFRIKNMEGGQSEIQLHSLDHEHQVEQKFKSMRFSMIFISEIDQFDDRQVMDILLDQLRLPGVPYEHHQLIADCNPPMQGSDHWVYRALVDQDPGNKERLVGSKYHHFALDENWFLPEIERNELKRKYEYDKIKYQRFVEGLWVKDTTSSYFDGIFIPSRHVVGNCSSPNKDNWEVLVPIDGTPTIVVGCDLGDVNHAAVFMAARINETGEVIFDIFDELVSIKNPISINQFAIRLLEKVDYWNSVLKTKEGKIPLWRFWCDTSSMRFRGSAGKTDASVVYQATGGRIMLFPAQKGPDSILPRINLAKRLFHEDRLFISASCRDCIGWATFLRKGRGAGRHIATDLDVRHSFDACTYALSMEIPIEIDEQSRPLRQRRGDMVCV